MPEAVRNDAAGNMAGIHADRRGAPRTRCNFNAEFRVNGSAQVLSGRVVDISKTGMRVKPDDHFPDGPAQNIAFMVWMGERMVRLKGAVVRRTPNGDFGICFNKEAEAPGARAIPNINIELPLEALRLADALLPQPVEEEPAVLDMPAEAPVRQYRNPQVAEAHNLMRRQHYTLFDSMLAAHSQRLADKRVNRRRPV